MFKKLFQKPAHAPVRPPPPVPPLPTQPEALAAARQGGLEVFACLTAWMKKGGRVHVESMLCALGALAGYACQAQLRAQARATGRPGDAPFHVVTGRDGRRYFFGDPLNGLLVDPRMSVWTLCSGAMGLKAGAGLPDLNELFQHVTASVGTDAFGVPRLPAAHQPAETPIAYLKALWPQVGPIASRHCPDPALWSVVFCAAVKRTMQVAHGTIAPELAFRIVMEAAVAMSKADLDGA